MRTGGGASRLVTPARRLFDEPGSASRGSSDAEPSAHPGGKVLPPGVTYMTDQQLRAYGAEQAELKIQFMAKHVAGLPSHEARAAWLAQLSEKGRPETVKRVRDEAWALLTGAVSS